MLFDDYGFEWVDGYKHRKLLAEIGWEYSVEEGYYTTKSDVVIATDILEECLGYKNNGVPNLERCILSSLDDTTYILSADLKETYEQLLVEADHAIRGFMPNRMSYVYNYMDMIGALMDGETIGLLNFAQDRMDRVEYFFRGEFEI